MENFLVVKVQASIRQQRIYQSMVEEQARMQAHVPTHMQSVPGPNKSKISVNVHAKNTVVYNCIFFTFLIYIIQMCKNAVFFETIIIKCPTISGPHKKQ